MSRSFNIDDQPSTCVVETVARPSWPSSRVAGRNEEGTRILLRKVSVRNACEHSQKKRPWSRVGDGGTESNNKEAEVEHDVHGAEAETSAE